MSEIEKKDDIRVITYTNGQDYRVIYNEMIDKNDIFYNQYIKAFRLLNNIVVSNYDAKENKDNYIEEAKNIIGFCGERGQGKTTAMIRFKNMLENLNKKKDISKNIIDDLRESYKNEYKLNHEKFYCLDIIDPSKFEDFSSILDIVVLKIYNDIKKDMSNERRNNDYDDLRKALDRAYKSICLFKNPKECMSKQYDLDFGITKLSIISENMKVRENISTLVDEYLKFKSNSTSAANKYLVISIDDLDLDTKRSYEISEEIRKYLDCDNIIVIMAVRTKQLLYSVEREFLDDYKIMLNEKVMDEGEIHKMAYKYVDKLLPERNRIYLPKLNSKFDIAKLEIKYVENSKDIKDDDTKNMESFILNMIYKKTGMIFYQKGEVHTLIPDTLRELISLLSFLTELEDYNEDMSLRNNNLELFEEYFFNHWVNDNLNNNENEILRKIRNSNDEEFNYNILYDVFKQDENDKVQNDEIIYNKSIGDVYKKLINTSNIIDGKIYNKNKFISALKIMITIRLNKIDCGCRIESSKKYYIDLMKNIVGDKLFTNEIDIKNSCTDSINKKIMSYNGKINESRYYFKMDFANFSKDKNLINEFDRAFIKIVTRKNIFNIIESKKNNLKAEINYGEYEIMNLDNFILFCFYKDYYKDLFSEFEISKEIIYYSLCEDIKKMVLNADVLFAMLNGKQNKASDLSKLVKNIQKNSCEILLNDNNDENINVEGKYEFLSIHKNLLDYQVCSDIENFKYNKYSSYEKLKKECFKLGYIKKQIISDNGSREIRKNKLVFQIIYILSKYESYLVGEYKEYDDCLYELYEMIIGENEEKDLKLQDVKNILYGVVLKLEYVSNSSFYDLKKYSEFRFDFKDKIKGKCNENSFKEKIQNLYKILLNKNDLDLWEQDNRVEEIIYKIHSEIKKEYLNNKILKEVESKLKNIIEDDCERYDDVLKILDKCFLEKAGFGEIDEFNKLCFGGKYKVEEIKNFINDCFYEENNLNDFIEQYLDTVMKDIEINKKSKKENFFNRVYYIIYIIQKSEESFNQTNLYYFRILKMYYAVYSITNTTTDDEKEKIAVEIEELLVEVRKYYNLNPVK